jgi:hypothetical protein
MKVIQEIIQIDGPVSWSMDNKLKIAKESKNLKLYNSIILHTQNWILCQAQMTL